MFTIQRLQYESKAWVTRNFGARPAHQPVLGLAEEYGELLSAESMADIQDAIADIAIFLTDVCNCVGIKMEYLDLNGDTIPYSTTLTTLERDIGKYIGKLSHHFLKREQSIRGSAADHENKMAVNIQNLFVTLKNYATLSGFNFMHNLERVWSQVSKRDWTKSRVTAPKPLSISVLEQSNKNSDAA